MHIEINNLSCGYKRNAVVHDISFDIREKEMWCILGANGVGKTTFFKTLLGLLAAVRGSIKFDGRAISELSRRELAAKIAYVPQNHVPPFPFSVLEIVCMGRNPHLRGMGKLNALDKAAVYGAIEILGIGYLKNAIYTQISGGERQLVLLARAIAQQTPVLILDEPVANLDFGNHARVMKHICALVETLDRTIIMTTHFPDHGFIADANVLLLKKDGTHIVGKGKDIMAEEAVRGLYNIDNRIIDIAEYDKTVCIAL